MREEAALFCTKKRNPFCFKTHHFPKSRISYQWEFGASENWRVSVHKLNATIVKSFFDPNNFQERFNWKHSKKKGKQISSKRMTLQSPYIFNIQIDFLLCCTRSALMVMHIYAHWYTRVIWLHTFCLFFLFFAFILKTMVDVIGLNPLV